MKQLKLEIIEHKRIAQGFYKMRLGSTYLAKNSKPGQFVEIKCSESDEVLLRRPLGVHRILNGGIEVLYEVIGRGTELLSRKRPGDTIDVIGPLGNGFSFTWSTVHSPQSTVLIAGGVGIAPLVALAEALVHGPCLAGRQARSMARSKSKKMYVLIGSCKEEQILCANDFRKLDAEVILYTEDGSLGKKGLVTDGLNSLLWTMPACRQGRDHGLSTIYACGPIAMLKVVAKIAEAKRVPCQVSMEERMACGVGVCLGCPVKVKSGGYKMACKDGPVFNSEEIVW